METKFSPDLKERVRRLEIGHKNTRGILIDRSTDETEYRSALEKDIIWMKWGMCVLAVAGIVALSLGIRDRR